MCLIIATTCIPMATIQARPIQIQGLCNIQGQHKIQGPHLSTLVLHKIQALITIKIQGLLSIQGPPLHIQGPPCSIQGPPCSIQGLFHSIQGCLPIWEIELIICKVHMECHRCQICLPHRDFPECPLTLPCLKRPL